MHNCPYVKIENYIETTCFNVHLKDLLFENTELAGLPEVAGPAVLLRPVCSGCSGLDSGQHRHPAKHKPHAWQGGNDISLEFSQYSEHFDNDT